MKVIICEDEQYWCKTILGYILKWGAAQNIVPVCEILHSPNELISYLDGDKDVNVIFLDISFDNLEIDGMTMAKKIRQSGNDVPIVFVTSDAYRAADGYLVDAIGFLSKPIDESRLFFFMDKIHKGNSDKKRLKVMKEGRVTAFYQKDVIFVEIIDHMIIFHTLEKDIETRGTLASALTELGKEEFCQIHRSYIVSIKMINSIKTTYPHSVCLQSGEKTLTLPVSRKYINLLIEAYSKDLMEIFL